MAYEEKRVVSTDPAVVDQTTVHTAPAAVPDGTTYVETRPNRTIVNNDDPVGNAFAASQLIQTIVWSVVVLVLLVIGIYLLYHYGII